MNGILIIDKPAGWTSHDVVAKLRGIMRERRIGHGGTLDPMATGVLPVFVGQATKAVEFAENAVKRYTAGLRLGVTTDTQDTTGTVLDERPVSIESSELLQVLERFKGRVLQTPPMYSAIKVNGERLYKIARRGGSVERPPREIDIFSLDLLGREGDDYILDITCSKGTYVRTLCHDIGSALGCGGAMSSLRRTEAGSFTLRDAVTLEAVQRSRDAGSIDDLLLPVDALFKDVPKIYLSDSDERLIRNGRSIPCPGQAAGRYRVYSQNCGFLLLGAVSDGELSSVKNFFSNQ